MSVHKEFIGLYKTDSINTSSVPSSNYQRHFLGLNLKLYSECIKRTTEWVKMSKQCSFCRFRLHPHINMRVPSRSLFLKIVELASKRTYLYSYVTYCYIGLQQCLFKGLLSIQTVKSGSSDLLVIQVHMLYRPTNP